MKFLIQIAFLIVSCSALADEPDTLVYRCQPKNEVGLACPFVETISFERGKPESIHFVIEYYAGTRYVIEPDAVPNAWVPHPDPAKLYFIVRYANSMNNGMRLVVDRTLVEGNGPDLSFPIPDSRPPAVLVYQGVENYRECRSIGTPNETCSTRVRSDRVCSLIVDPAANAASGSLSKCR